MNYNELFTERNNKKTLTLSNKVEEIKSPAFEEYSHDDYINRKKIELMKIRERISNTKFYLKKNKKTDDTVIEQCNLKIKRLQEIANNISDEIRVEIQLKHQELTLKQQQLSIEKHDKLQKNQRLLQKIEQSENTRFAKQIIKEFVKIRDGIKDGFLTTDSILVIINNAFDRFEIDRIEARKEIDD